MNSRLGVLITGVGGRSVGHQILQALLPLQDRYRLVVTDADSFSYGLYQAESRYVVPRATAPGYLEAIRRLICRERIDVILPGTEPEVFVLARYKDELSGCELIVNPAEVVDLCSNKWRLFEWLCENGFNTPQTVCGSEWRALAEQVGFPLVGKPAENSGGSRGVQILNSAAEIELYLGTCPEPEKALFQQYVGNRDGEFTVGVVISKGGRIVDSIVLQRTLTGLSLGSARSFKGHSYALSTGYSQGIIIRHPRIQTVCEELALRLGARGPLNIQCRLVDNQVYVFEVHPRFSGTSSIRATAGFNEPDLIIRERIFGEAMGRQDYQTKVAAIRAFSNLLVPLSTMEGVVKI